jgi:hypothetical protein
MSTGLVNIILCVSGGIKCVKYTEKSKILIAVMIV